MLHLDMYFISLLALKVFTIVGVSLLLYEKLFKASSIAILLNAIVLVFVLWKTVP